MTRINTHLDENALYSLQYSYLKRKNEKHSIIENTEEDLLIIAIKQLERVAIKITTTTEMPFDIVWQERIGVGYIKPTPLGNEIIQVLNSDLLGIEQAYPMHVFNPYVTVLRRVCINKGRYNLVHALRNLDVELAKKVLFELNKIVRVVRRVYWSRTFKDAVKNHLSCARQNFRECGEYMALLLEKCSKLVILRVDLYYLEHFREAIDAEAARKSLDKFLRALREGRIVPNVVGYITKREYGLKRGFHFHVLVAMNGHEHRQGINYAEIIGECWQEYCTGPEKMGSYFNCLAHVDHYRNCGIGLVHVSDQDKLKGLRKALVYMTKPDYYIKVVTPDGERNLRKGIKPKNKSNRGAPRKNEYDTIRMRKILLSDSPE